MNPAAPQVPSRSFGGGRAFLEGAVLVVAVVIAYVTVFHAGWVWDDDAHVTANATIIGPLGLKEIWTTSAANYFPLVLTNFWLQHAAWGVDPLGYHLVTVLFHAASALVLWRVLVQLRVPGAWWGAMLWSLHPVQVESVAWISELKNTQSALFFLLAILCFVRWRERTDSGGGFYFLSLGCALCALMSKPSTVMLPPALALIVWWQDRRISLRDVVRLAPFFLLSAIVAGWTIWEQKVHSGAIGEEWNQSLAERLVIAGRVPWFYLGKLLWPHPLIFIYPRWEPNAASWLDWLPLGAVVGTLVALALMRAAWARVVLVTLLYFGLLLFPILGFFSVYFFRYSFVGDHFQYLASMGPLALIGAGLAWLGTLRARGFESWVRGAAAAIVVVLSFVTWRHSHTFLSFETLWKSTLAQNSTCTMAWINLAGDYAKLQRYEEAVTAYREALRLKPDAADVHNDLAGSYFLMKQYEPARVEYAKAVSLKPEYPDALTGLGNALHALGQRSEARAAYAEALRLDPDFAQAHNNLATDLAETGEFARAIQHYEAALRAQPDDVFARTNLERCLVNQGKDLSSVGRIDDSLVVFRRAAELAPDSAPALANIATTLAIGGRWAESAKVWQQAVTLAPQDVALRRQLAIALVNADQLEASVPHFEQALRLEPTELQTRQQFVQVLDVLGRKAEARAQAEEIARLSRGAAP